MHIKNYKITFAIDCFIIYCINLWFDERVEKHVFTFVTKMVESLFSR